MEEWGEREDNGNKARPLREAIPLASLWTKPDRGRGKGTKPLRSSTMESLLPKIAAKVIIYRLAKVCQE